MQSLLPGPMARSWSRRSSKPAYLDLDHAYCARGDLMTVLPSTSMSTSHSASGLGMPRRIQLAMRMLRATESKARFISQDEMYISAALARAVSRASMSWMVAVHVPWPARNVDYFKTYISQIFSVFMKTMTLIGIILSHGIKYCVLCFILL